MPKAVLIKCAVFDNLQSSTNGGAISLYGASGIVEGNQFNNCFTTSEAGAIYFSKSDVFIRNNNFEYCFDYHSDAKYGNAVKCDSGNLINVSYCSVYKCGPSNTECGDSGLAFFYLILNMNFVNCSYNFDCSGATFIRFVGNSQSSISYCQCLYCYSDYSMFEINIAANFSKCNFVNDSNIKIYSLASHLETAAKLDHFVMIDCSKPLLSKFIFENSYCNNGNYGITSTDSYSNIRFSPILCARLDSNIKSCPERVYDSHQIQLHVLVVFLSLDQSKKY